MTTAFVLPGGASLGAIQAGMVAVLAEQGIEPDLLVGASVGALNATWLASRRWPVGAETLPDVWDSVRRTDVFPISPLRIVRGLLGLSDHLVNPAALTRWMSVRAPIFRLEQAVIPLYVMATELRTGTPVVLSSGDAVEALLASAAIPGIFPPVTIDGRALVDGGLGAPTPIAQAIDLGADEVYVLPTFSGAAQVVPRGARGPFLLSMAHVLGQLSQREIRANASRCTLYVVPPPATGGVSLFDFRYSRRLISLGRAAASAWVASRQPVPADA